MKQKKQIITTQEAVEKIVRELKEDEGYYISWVSNIAMSMHDAYAQAKDKKDIHAISNEGAKQFLNNLMR